MSAGRLPTPSGIQPEDAIQAVIAGQKRGEARGIYAVCSANRHVLAACMLQALQDGTSLLVESTSNQVNQFGGYSGLTPTQFRGYLFEIAAGLGFPPERLILGGDHLGPHPWQGEPAQEAMDKACQLVQDCVRAGYTKIHLDASMRLGDDPPGQPLARRLAAERAADLCQAAEQAAGELPHAPRPMYVIGTEVPPPGGSTEGHGEIEVTHVEDARETIELTRAAFAHRGLLQAWERVIALVVQPGVEFGDEKLFEYDRSRAAALSRFIEGAPGMVYEAHSTDYQDRQALRNLVADHFAILKVGPALTFAFREAVFALAMIEDELLGESETAPRSRLIETVEAAMLREPRYWQAYHSGAGEHARLARKYSLSDRIRYYWPDPQVSRALAQLLENLSRQPIPAGLLSQFLPVQYRHLRQGKIGSRPLELIYDRIRETVVDYAWACRWAKE